MVARDPTNAEVLSRLDCPETREFYRWAIRVALADGKSRDEIREDMGRAIVVSFRLTRGTVLDRGLHYEESYYSVAMRVFEEVLTEFFGL